MKRLHISDDLSLPVDAVTGTFCVVGIRGSGKSTTAVDMAEEMLKAKQQIVVLDPKDDWWGLRSSADGASEGLPVTILGGSHQDAPLESTAGALVAELILNERISAIISTKHLSDGQRFRFTYDFCDFLYKHCKEPLHLFIDEADQFAPQEKNVRIQKGDNVSEAMMLSLVRRVIKQGRTSGLGSSLITQSPATLDKRVMNMCETLIAMRVVGAQDFDAVERWFKVYLRKKEDLESIVSRLPTLKAGEGVFYSPAWLEVSKVVKFRLPETFDSRKTPKVGERRVEPKVLAPVDLERLSERMAATIENAKANDPEFLKKEKAELRREVIRLGNVIANYKPSPSAATTEKIKTVVKTVEKPVVRDTQIARLEKIAGALGKRLDAVIEPLATMREFKISLDGLIAKVQNVNGASSPPPPVQQPQIAERSSVAEPTQRAVRLPIEKTTNGDYDMADFEEFYQKTVQRLQQDGFAVTVKVEPKEVVLKQFQQAEVERLLAETESLGEFAKQSLKWIESRGGRAAKAEYLRAITGKDSASTSGSVKTDRYKQIDDLVDLGFLNKDSNGFGSNIATAVSARLAAYNASDSDVQAVIGEVLLKLK